jgi:hypothetical protein
MNALAHWLYALPLPALFIGCLCYAVILYGIVWASCSYSSVKREWENAVEQELAERAAIQQAREEQARAMRSRLVVAATNEGHIRK